MNRIIATIATAAIAATCLAGSASAADRAEVSGFDRCANLKGEQLEVQKRVVWRWKVRTPEAGDCRRIWGDIYAVKG